MKCYHWKLHRIIICMILLLFISFCLVQSMVSASEKQGIRLPIIMYHSFLKDTSKSNAYIVTPSTLEQDLIYLAKHHYHTITMTELINYVYNDIALPENPIILTFDDGHYNNLGYAVPLLKKYQMKAVISIVGSYTDTYTKSDEANLNYSYLRWKDIQELMQDSDSTIEFQNHTYNLHTHRNGRNGSMKKKNESTSTYQTLLENDIMKLQEEFKEHTGYLPNTFTYPFGMISKESLPVIQKLDFKASLSCASGINYITKNPEDLYCLKRYNRPSRYFY